MYNYKCPFLLRERDSNYYIFYCKNKNNQTIDDCSICKQYTSTNGTFVDDVRKHLESKGF